MLLTVLLLIGLHRIPFTCSYVPGRANVKLLWWLYLFALIGYSYQMARLEIWLLADPWRWSVAIGGIAVAAIATRLVRDRVDAWREPLRFESDDDGLQTLELMRPI